MATITNATHPYFSNLETREKSVSENKNKCYSTGTTYGAVTVVVAIATSIFKSAKEICNRYDKSFKVSIAAASSLCLFALILLGCFLIREEEEKNNYFSTHSDSFYEEKKIKKQKQYHHSLDVTVNGCKQQSLAKAITQSANHKATGVSLQVRADPDGKNPTCFVRTTSPDGTTCKKYKIDGTANKSKREWRT